MQLSIKEYNPDFHDKFKALTVKQPYADLLTKVVSRDEEGNYHAAKSIEIRSRITNYRGELLICSSAKPIDPWGRHQAGVTCGFVDLYDVKRVEDFTEEDWKATCIPVNERPATGYGWMMRNPRRVIEMPVKGQLGIYDMVFPKEDIMEYPREVEIGKDGWEIIQRKIRH